MHLFKLLHTLPFLFAIQDVEEKLNIKKASARVLCNRYTQKGIFLRLRRNLYMFKDNFSRLIRYQLFPISAEIQKNSYISFSSALLYHGIFRGYPSLIEAATTQRSWRRHVDQVTFQYYKLPKKYYFSYIEDKGGFKIATPEKALLDLFYFYSLGRYFVHLRHINLERIDFEKLFNLSAVYPTRTQKLLSRLYARAHRRPLHT